MAPARVLSHVDRQRRENVTGLIEIVPYRTSWPAEFEALAAELQRALGARALAIHHIGSTAVVGLDAKDVIDIQVSVKKLDADAIRPALESLGYDWRDDIRTDHMPPGASLPDSELAKLYASKLDPRRVHCHLRVPGKFNHRYALLCRDYLRSHAETAAAYCEIKRQLARRFPDDADAYYDIKDPVFDLIMGGAEEWARRVEWP